MMYTGERHTVCLLFAYIHTYVHTYIPTCVIMHVRVSIYACVVCVLYTYLPTYIYVCMLCVWVSAVQAIRCSVVKQCTCLFSVECKQ